MFLHKNDAILYTLKHIYAVETSSVSHTLDSFPKGEAKRVDGSQTTAAPRAGAVCLYVEFGVFCCVMYVRGDGIRIRLMRT